MPSTTGLRSSPTRADVDARIGETFLTLNQIAASLALIERSCSRVLEELPVDDDEALEHALALRAATIVRAADARTAPATCPTRSRPWRVTLET